jgi:hypothetical protein
MRTLLFYAVGLAVIGAFMNEGIVKHKVLMKCSICGKDIVVDQRAASGKVYHMACAMEVNNSGSVDYLDEYRKLRNGQDK